MISGISDRAEFARLRSNGLHVRSRDLRCRVLLDDNAIDSGPHVQVAYSVSRKVGNAVVRNRLRRRLRAIFAEVTSNPSAPTLRSALVIVLPSARDRSFADLRDQVQELMKKIEKSTRDAE